VIDPPSAWDPLKLLAMHGIDWEKRKPEPNIQTFEKTEGALALEKPDKQTLDLIWDTVWWRRVAYFATVAATMLLAVYPFAPDVSFAVTQERLQGLYDLASTPASWLADILSAFLPGLAKPWLDAIRTSPFTVLGLIFGIVILLWWGRILDRRIHDRALAAWNKDWRSTRFAWFQSNMQARIYFTSSIVAMAAASLWQSITAILSEPPGRSHDTALVTIIAGIINSPLATIYTVFIVAAVLYYLIWLVKQNKAGEAERRELMGFSLRVANRIRTSAWAGPVVTCTSDVVVPAFFAFAVFVTCLSALNKAAFTSMSAGGWVCASQDPAQPLPVNGFTMSLDLKNGCQQSHYILRGGTKYLVEIKAAEGWSEGSVQANQSLVLPLGFATPWWSAPHILTLPFRRVLTEQWFAPMARVRAAGSQDYVLGVGVTTIAPQRSGELFFYVNDSVIGLPWIWDAFYKNNRGTAMVTVLPAQESR
jgi:hypothetical protein